MSNAPKSVAADEENSKFHSSLTKRSPFSFLSSSKSKPATVISTPVVQSSLEAKHFNSAQTSNPSYPSMLNKKKNDDYVMDDKRDNNETDEPLIPPIITSSSHGHSKHISNQDKRSMFVLLVLYTLQGNVILYFCNIFSFSTII